MKGGGNKLEIRYFLKKMCPPLKQKSSGVHFERTQNLDFLVLT